jgi:ubiquinone/menaquinone biosynthesis C-methylase UbiE
VLDLGCGEGYCSRQLRHRGAAELFGIDLSDKMIDAALEQENEEPLGIHYSQGCATDLSRFADGELDLVMAVFLFNYLTVDQTRQCMREVARILRKGGRFIFSVPHPAFPYLRSPEPPFYFKLESNGYFSTRDARYAGRIWKRDGTFLDVQLVHKTFEDYFTALRDAGFQSMPVMQELRVRPEHLELDPAFFTPIADLPLHLAIQVSR